MPQVSRHFAHSNVCRFRGRFFVTVTDKVLTDIQNSAFVTGSFSFLLFREGGFIMAAHPLGWITLFGAVPAVQDATLTFSNCSRMDLTAVMATVASQNSHQSNITTFSKLQLITGEEKKRYIAVTVAISNTPFSLITFAPYQAAGMCFCHPWIFSPAI